MQPGLPIRRCFQTAWYTRNDTRHAGLTPQRLSAQYSVLSAQRSAFTSILFFPRHCWLCLTPCLTPPRDDRYIVCYDSLNAIIYLIRSNIDMPLDQYLEIAGGSAMAQLEGDVLLARS